MRKRGLRMPERRIVAPAKDDHLTCDNHPTRRLRWD
jgi:hypothetical protein